MEGGLKRINLRFTLHLHQKENDSAHPEVVKPAKLGEKGKTEGGSVGKVLCNVWPTLLGRVKCNLSPFHGVH